MTLENTLSKANILIYTDQRFGLQEETNTINSHVMLLSSTPLEPEIVSSNLARSYFSFNAVSYTYFLHIIYTSMHRYMKVNGTSQVAQVDRYILLVYFCYTVYVSIRNKRE